MNKKCQVFTPENYVRELLDSVGYTEHLYGRKILENSCGDGNILVAVVQRYIDDCVANGLSRTRIKNGLARDIYGVEIDPEQFQKCIENLNKVLEKNNINKVEWKIFNDDYLRWNDVSQFQFIVGNPPYITYSELAKDEQKYVKENFNTYAVKQTKELDDNSQSKNDRKDPKVIAKLVTEGRYSAPYTPDGVYADLRIMVANRKRLIREMTQIKNRFARWFAIYFPEYTDVFGDYEAQSSMLLLKKVCTPEAIVELGAEKINQIWRDAKLRAVGMKRATTLCETAKRSIGLKKGSSAARYEMKLLLEDYEYKKAQLDAVMEEIEKLCRKIPESEQMLAIKGIGVITVAGFLAEVGDVRRFESPRQIQKLAGLSLRENSSGKHKGQTTISKRGRSKLRAVLFNAAIPLIAKNPEFKSLHEYYTTRANNPLKKKQSVIAISCKLIRVFYAILAKGVTYDAQKLISDIHRQPQVA